MHADRSGKPCSLEPSSYNMYALCACIKFITRSFTELCATVNSYDLKKREGGGGLAFSITFESMKLYERICHIFRKNVLLLIPHKYSSPPTLQTIMFKNIKDDRGIPYI